MWAEKEMVSDFGIYPYEKYYTLNEQNSQIKKLHGIQISRTAVCYDVSMNTSLI